jgi:hypothetical protein
MVVPRACAPYVANSSGSGSGAIRARAHLRWSNQSVGGACGPAASRSARKLAARSFLRRPPAACRGVSRLLARSFGSARRCARTWGVKRGQRRRNTEASPYASCHHAGRNRGGPKGALAVKVSALPP